MCQVLVIKVMRDQSSEESKKEREKEEGEREREQGIFKEHQLSL